MTQTQTLSHHRRPDDFHRRPYPQTDLCMHLCLHDGKHSGESKSQNRRSNNRHVMLVQRGAFERQVMSEMLSVLGYRVTRVEDSCKALLNFGHEPCEVVISELDVPQFDGFQLARCIRKHSPQTRIPLMTPCCHAEVADYGENFCNYRENPNIRTMNRPIVERKID